MYSVERDETETTMNLNEIATNVNSKNAHTYKPRYQAQFVKGVAWAESKIGNGAKVRAIFSWGRKTSEVGADSLNRAFGHGVAAFASAVEECEESTKIAAFEVRNRENAKAAITLALAAGDKYAIWDFIGNADLEIDAYAQEASKMLRAA